jgi:hypothetical protein
MKHWPTRSTDAGGISMKSISAARCAFVTVATTGLILVGVPPSRAQVPAKWNTFSTEVTLNRYDIGADGKPAGFKAPAVTYRFERVAAPWGWRTSFSLIAAERQKVQSLKGPDREIDSLSVVRLEDDGDGTPIRVTTRDGRRPVSRLPVSAVKDGLDKVLSLNPGLPASMFTTTNTKPSQSASDRDWVDSIVASPGKGSARRAALIGRYGGSTGRHQGFDRYESVQGPHRIEVLADPQSSVVVAMNSFRDGIALDRTTLIYTHAHGALVRKGIRSERRISAERRAVTEVEFSKVSFEQRENQ